MTDSTDLDKSRATRFIRKMLGMEDTPKPSPSSKPSPVEATRKLSPSEGEVTRIRPPQAQPKFDVSATQEMTGPQEPPSGWKQAPREDMRVFEEQSRMQEPVTRRMPRPDEKTTIKRKMPAPEAKKSIDLKTRSLGPSRTLLSPDKTMRNVPREEIFNKEDLKFLEKVKRNGFRTVKANLGKLVIGGIVGAIAGALILGGAFAAIGYVVNKIHEKVGSTDLSMLLPSATEVVWLSASFTRQTRDEADPYWEPNVLEEKVTFYSPYDEVMAFGVSLEGLPEVFSNDIDVNDLGFGTSDWLCEPFSGYLICRSLGSYPLTKEAATTVSMKFHLPAYEMKEYLSVGSGSRQVYVIVPKE